MPVTPKISNPKLQQNITPAISETQQITFPNFLPFPESSESEDEESSTIRFDGQSSTLMCEYCNQISYSGYLSTSKTAGLKLCSACKSYETKHGKLVPREERNKTGRKPNIQNKKACEYCKQISSSGHLSTSKTTDLGLCHACKRYETKYGKLVPREERKKGSRKPNIQNKKVCEYCKQISSNGYLSTSKTTGLELCRACKQYEMKYDELIPRYKKGKFHKTKKSEQNKIIDIPTTMPPLEYDNLTNMDTKKTDIKDNIEISNVVLGTETEIIHNDDDEANHYTCYTCSTRAIKIYQLKPCCHLMCINCAFQGLETQCPVCGKNSDQCIEKHIS